MVYSSPPCLSSRRQRRWHGSDTRHRCTLLPRRPPFCRVIATTQWAAVRLGFSRAVRPTSGATTPAWCGHKCDSCEAHAVVQASTATSRARMHEHCRLVCLGSVHVRRMAAQPPTPAVSASRRHPVTAASSVCVCSSARTSSGRPKLHAPGVAAVVERMASKLRPQLQRRSHGPPAASCQPDRPSADR